MKLRTEHKLLTVFSYSSLTDIVFLLLIFFLLSSSFVIQPGIKVQLPKAERSEQESRTQIVITVTEKGQVYLNDQVVAIEMLGGRLSQLLQSSPGEVVVIKADQAVSLQSAVQVMDIAKGVGATRLLIATQPTL
ncbi:MAG: biopolymer transporter ExbD [Bacteroidota bacterium]